MKLKLQTNHSLIKSLLGLQIAGFNNPPKHIAPFRGHMKDYINVLFYYFVLFVHLQTVEAGSRNSVRQQIASRFRSNISAQKLGWLLSSPDQNPKQNNHPGKISFISFYCLCDFCGNTFHRQVLQADSINYFEMENEYNKSQTKQESLNTNYFSILNIFILPFEAKPPFGLVKQLAK